MGFHSRSTSTYKKAACAKCGKGCDGLKDVQRQYNRAPEEAISAITKVNTFTDGVISGAAGCITALEATRDVSFAIVVGCAGATAAPMAYSVAAAKGVGGLGLVAVSAAAGSLGAGTAAGALNYLEQRYTNGGDIDWNEWWKEVKGGLLTGAIGGGAYAVGAFLGSAAASNAVAKSFAGRVAGYVGLEPGTVLLVIKTSFTAVTRQIVLNVAKMLQDENYDSDDFLRDMVLALLFAGLAQKLGVASRLGGHSPVLDTNIKIAGLGVTQNIITNVGKLLQAMGVAYSTTRADTANDATSTTTTQQESESHQSSTSLEENTSSEGSGSTGGIDAVDVHDPVATSVHACTNRATCCAMQVEGRAPLLSRRRKEDKEAVRALQTILSGMECCASVVGTVDGDFGGKTESAVEKFQKVVAGFSGRDVDGAVGPMTWGELCKATASA
eukprot:g2725.t1